MTIAAGQTSNTIDLSIVQDALDEADEKFVITMGSTLSNVTKGSDATHTATITDDDDPPTIGFDGTTASVTEAGTATLTVDLSAASGRDITIDYAVQAASTATGSGTDYTLSDGTKTISAGATSVNINVPTASDALDEDNETVVILLSNPTNSSLEDANKQMTLTITDDDPTPTIQFNNCLFYTSPSPRD